MWVTHMSTTKFCIRSLEGMCLFRNCGLISTVCIFIGLWHSGHEARITSALNISTGPLALRTFQTAGPVRASTLYLSLARQDHRVKCRASRLKITVARSMTNFAMFSCILFLKFRYVCIAWLLYINFNVNCFLRLCLHYVWSVTNIDVGRGKMGASRFSWGPVTFQIYWPPGPVAPGG